MDLEFRLVLNDSEISQVQIVFLVVLWKSNINYMSNNISKSIEIMRKLSFFLLKQSLLTLYYSMVHPYLYIILFGRPHICPIYLVCMMILQKRVITIINNSKFDFYTGLIFRIKFDDICKLQTGSLCFRMNIACCQGNSKVCFTPISIYITMTLGELMNFTL